MWQHNKQTKGVTNAVLSHSGMHVLMYSYINKVIHPSVSVGNAATTT